MTFVQIENRTYLIVNVHWLPFWPLTKQNRITRKVPSFFCVDSNKRGYWKHPQREWVFLTNPAAELMCLLFAARGIHMKNFHGRELEKPALLRIEHALSVVREGTGGEPDIAKRIMQTQENARILESVRV